jgi:thiamine-monophosphate kinase
MPPWVVVGPGDDAAVIEPERGALEVLTTDTLVEGIHFDRRFVPPDAIGHRALAVNLSDLAAMGARPRAALLSLVLPGTLELSALDGILDGLLALAGSHRVTLVGGNITRSPGPLVIDVTATGSVSRRRVLRRSSARPGDLVYVTGHVGDAAAGLRQLQAGDAPEAVLAERYLRPQPRVRAGLVLAGNRVASSCIDLSDGLADGLRQIARASNVGIKVDSSALPISGACRDWHHRSGGDLLETVFGGGDDYELLFTVKSAYRKRLRAVTRQLGDLPITPIGVVTKERDLVVSGANGMRALPTGFEHFR